MIRAIVFNEIDKYAHTWILWTDIKKMLQDMNGEMLFISMYWRAFWWIASKRNAHVTAVLMFCVKIKIQVLPSVSLSQNSRQKKLFMGHS